MEGAVTRTKSAHIWQCRREVQWGQVFTCLLPLGPLTFPLTDLAGTGRAIEFFFRAGVERFKGELVGYLRQQLAQRSMWDKVVGGSFPQFVQGRENRRVGVDTLIYPLMLLLYAIGFYLAAYMRFIRAEV
jgi:hypothetical protein